MAKSTPATPAPSYVVVVPFNRVDPDTLSDVRHELGDPYPSDGPAIDEYLDRGLIAPAGSASESSSEDQEN